MKDQKVKDVVVNVKNYFVEMPKKRKTIVGVVLGAVIALAVVVTVLLNINASKLTVLYSGLEQAEVNTIYQMLKEQGVAVQINAQQELLVPSDQYDELLLQMAGQGYPRSALTYDVFSSHAGLTTTESQSKQWLIYQLQDRIQQTLQRLGPVSDAAVTISIPDTSDYVWQQTEEKEHAKASVVLTLKAGQTLSPEQVDAVRNLVATGCPNMEASDVNVTDAKTGLTLSGTGTTGGAEAAGLNSTQNLELEQMVQQQLEDNIVRLLRARYGDSGVVAAAKVTINYDKMITEQKQLQEKPTGGGNATHAEGNYAANGEQTVGDIVGEQNNTDVPGYPYGNLAAQDGVTNFNWSIDYDYSYLKTQVEKGNYSVDRATISVMVNEPNLTDPLRTELTNLISTGADIPAAQINISSFATETQPVVEPEPVEPTGILAIITTLPWWVLVAAGGALLLLIALLIVIGSIRKKAKREAEAERKRLEQEAIAKVNQDIAEYKKQLSDAAKGDISEVDDAIMKEVKDFAKTNPEVTANLLRSWLKET